MVDPIGTQLQRAREQRRLSLEDAAHETKIRAQRLGDLEKDVYTNFPNLAYAKGFLGIYGRYLGVDVRRYVSGFDDTSTFGVDDYQYLSEVPVAQFRAPPHAARKRRRKVRLALPALAAATLAIGTAGWLAVIDFYRLGNLDELAARQDAAASPAGAAPAKVPAVFRADSSPALSLTSTPYTPSFDLAEPGFEFSGTVAEPAPTPLLASNPGLSPGSERPLSEGAESASVNPRLREVIVKPLRKTRIRVVVNDRAAQPAFEDWLTPDAQPLSFRGQRIYVHVQDKNSVEIRENGILQTQTGPDIYME